MGILGYKQRNTVLQYIMVLCSVSNKGYYYMKYKIFPVKWRWYSIEQNRSVRE